MILRVTLFLLCCSIGAMAEQQSVTTQFLYDDCKLAVRFAESGSALQNPAENVQVVYCFGFVTGFLHGIGLGGHSIGHLVSGEALFRPFVGYLNAHPAEIDADGPGPILIKAWLADGILVAKPLGQVN